MKLIFLIFFIFGAWAYAELPSNGIKDIPTRETTEYLDGKIDNINKSFVDSRSTATFAGWVDVGVSISTRTCPGTTCRAGCGNKTAIGGGCHEASGGPLIACVPSVESDSSDARGTNVSAGIILPHSWSVQTQTTASSVYVICARVK